MTYPEMIAIDGPAASGKTTLGLRLAQRLGYLFFDTGVMYRALTWAVLNQDISPADEEAVTRLAKMIQIDVLPPTQQDGRTSDVWVDFASTKLVERRDITWEIRQAEVEAQVSTIAAYKGVRKEMAAQQRRIGLRGKVVMVGRDIGTVVLPEAHFKIYLDASVEERARRRCKELRDRGLDADLEAIQANLRQRDQIDSNRAVAPLKPAEDALILGSDTLDAEQVLNTILRWLENPPGNPKNLKNK
jgi:cytidylate kinase